MTTPDNPIVQAPQPNGTGHSKYLFVSKVRRRSKHEGSGSPDSENGEMPQKICRVCGDFATGYNFNVMTCESCKAFFRRNALRPKEFKCPYSENCTMSSVSRRFCQKCRLRKCFAVGMKKEFILNDEQLRRRKNSRLKNDKSTTTSSSPLTVNPMSPIIMNLPGGPQYPSTSSPAGSSASNSPINRSMTAMHVGDKISEEYVPNAMAHRLPQSSSLNSASNLEDGGQVILSAEEYENLLARIPADARSPGLMNEDEPSKKR
ncbi:hypothetical protein CAEBREN_08904 [Caenorhabditis brenneri]|uniref:Nuclear receptor domain-containing protein n=1 Tax=Caenorhabditis brenneri TaxID=135651 RepID=G0P017_CAEBE|nr:hypothetical protein CAEBREN_08904 [Caenorhabditis brenneri]